MALIRLIEGRDALVGLDIRMRRALIEAARIYAKYGKRLTVTCGPKGEHSPGSLHPYGLAVDLRTRFFTKEEVEEAYRDLVNTLSPLGYDVLDEGSHFHIEYDAELQEG